jgi:hypothetical protein
MKSVRFAFAVLLLAGSAAIQGFAQAGPPPGPPPGPPMDKGFFVFMGAGRGWDKAVTGAPFSAQAVTESKQTLSDGNVIDHKNTASIYRDSEGRTRIDRTLSVIGPWSASGTPPEIITIHDPVAGVSFVLNAAKKIAYKMPMPPAGGNPPLRGAFMFGGGGGGIVTSGFLGGNGAASVSAGKLGESWQRSSQPLGSKDIDGVVAQGTQTTVVIPAGSIGNAKAITTVSERWYSPDLQIDVMTRRDDPRFGETTYQLTDIQLGEPSPSLFQVPPGYTVQEGPLRAHFHTAGNASDR